MSAATLERHDATLRYLVCGTTEFQAVVGCCELFAENTNDIFKEGLKPRQFWSSDRLSIWEII